MTADISGGGGWSAAEERVGALYRALGYKVARDVLNRGSQIDLVAEKHDPIVGRIRIGVEVKDHPGSSLPIQEVRNFLNNAQNALRRNDFDKAHLVTTGKVTKNGKLEVEGEAHVRVMTYEELEGELLQPDAALARWLDVYRQEPISRLFVEVAATGMGPVAAEMAPRERRIPSTHLLDVALADPTLGVVVLADYGSGKSTLLQRIKALAVQRRSADPSGVMPILIELRELAPDFDIEQVALGACRSELGVELPAASFWSLLQGGRFLILLDGFDEITLRASEETRERLLAGLSPLLFGASPAILTSRPSYFASFEEYSQLLSRMRGGWTVPPGAAPDERRINRHADRLLDRYRAKGPKSPLDVHAGTYRLEPLTSDQIDLFLENAKADLAAAGTTPGEVREFLDSVYDLSDLISRPIILDMALTSTVEGVIAPDQRTLQDGPSGLYAAYARVRLQRDWVSVQSRQELLSDDVRMRFAEECACHMDEHDVLRIERGEIAEVAGRTLALGEGDELEAVLTDLRTCSFLTIDDSGALEFIHRSYQEYFVARRIRDDITRNLTGRLRRPLRWEYAYFLGAMGYTNSDVYQRFIELSRSRTADRQVADNAAQAVLVARDVARGLDWRERQVCELRRSRTQIVGSTLHKVELRGLRVEQVVFTDCTLDVCLEGDAVEEVTLTNCTGTVDVRERILRVAADGGDLTFRDPSGVRGTAFESMKLRLRSASPSHTLRNVTGRADIGPAVVDVAHSDLRLGCSGTIEGVIADSLLDLESDGWDCLAAALTSTAVVVHGVRPKTSASTGTQRSRKVIDESRAGSGAVLVIDPSVTADRWWARQSGLISIGARIADARTNMAGLFVYEKPYGAAPSFGFWIEHTGTVVMEGRGARYEEAVAELSGAVKQATARQVSDGTWVSNSLLPLLDQLGCPADATRHLAELVAARVGAAGPSS